MNLIDFLTKFLKTIEKNSLLASQVALVVKNPLSLVHYEPFVGGQAGVA